MLQNQWNKFDEQTKIIIFSLFIIGLMLLGHIYWTTNYHFVGENILCNNALTWCVKITK